MMSNTDENKVELIAGKKVRVKVNETKEKQSDSKS